MSPLQEKAAQEMLLFLGSVYRMSDALLADIREILQCQSLKRREILLKENQICRNIYFVAKGALRLYYYTDQGTPVTTWFMRETDICVSVDSFYGQVPSYEYIRAEEDSELFYISYEQLETLYRKHMEFNFIGRVLTIKYLLDLFRQLKDIRLLDTEKRWDALEKRDPELIRRFHQNHIASFLSMLPTSLSRTLDQKKKKKKQKKK